MDTSGDKTPTSKKVSLPSVISIPDNEIKTESIPVNSPGSQSEPNSPYSNSSSASGATISAVAPGPSLGAAPANNYTPVSSGFTNVITKFQTAVSPKNSKFFKSLNNPEFERSTDD